MKKLVLSLIVFTATLFTITALPGVNHFINDASGEYVYYQDKSFTRESYIGFLTYDELTYAARYFAPACDNLPEKNIIFLFTLDSTKSYIDISGERFLTPVSQEDTVIVNYIHDLVFELGKRRQNIGEISPNVEKDNSVNPLVSFENSTVLLNSGFKSKEEMYQFGGDVNIYYDYLVPIFNIKKIEHLTDSVFEVVAVGTLKSSEDLSFAKFSPIPPANNLKPHKNTGKKSAPKIVEFENSSVKLDENWEQLSSVENVLFYGDAAILIGGTGKKSDFYSYLKALLLSANQSFKPWKNISIIKNKNQITVYSNVYTGESNNCVISSVLLKGEKLDKDQLSMLSMTVAQADYQKEKKYFTDIFKSWK